MNIKLIIGLGNKNKKLFNTRHNVGIWFIKKFLELKKITLNKIYIINKYKNKIFLYTPKSYINKCGKLILKIKKKLKIKNKNILIAYDDINLLPGNSKIQKNVNKISTHNGIKNIIKYIKKNNFYKLRIGIGRPKNSNLINYVISKPNNIEKKLIKKSIKKCIFYIKKLIKYNNLKKIQNLINKTSI